MLKGIYRWDKMTPSFPTVLKKGRSGRTASISMVVYYHKTLDELEIPSWRYRSIIDDYTEMISRVV